MPLPAVLELLHRELVPYSVIPHAPATTSPETASAAAVSGRDLAKTVMILVDGKLAMAVRAAADYANFDELRDQIGARRVDSAHPDQFRDLCPTCEPGTIPPIGPLWGLDVYVDEALSRNESLTFKAGSHRDLLRIAWRDFERLVHPRLLDFASSQVGWPW
ncbi:MAG TPA: YbaK/EbsC family protein [Gemmatimonadales bacterium]|nr:YbaK/EbsC family protein [Gemmatimonadales bacterium]